MSIKFEDRVSSYPNRYLVTPESGNPYYVTLSRADEPIREGTPLNAETFNSLVSETTEAVRYTEQELTEKEQGMARMNIGLYPMNGCLICHGEQVTISTEDYSLKGKTLTFKYRYSDGYSYTLTDEAGGGSLNPNTTYGKDTTKSGYGDASIQLSSTTTSLRIKGAYFILFAVSVTNIGVETTYENGNEVDY